MLQQAPPATKRVGHGGASALRRANTLASFDAALAVGVDMIEFDVRPWRGRLVLAHTRAHSRLADCLTLERALAHLAGPRFAAVGLNVDVKRPGCEEALLDALERHGVRERSLISSQCRPVVARVRELAPDASVGISIGGRVARRSQRWGDWRTAVLAALRARRLDAVMVQHRLVDRALVEATRELGAELYAWTVNEAHLIARLQALGVTGITTSDPRLFAAAGAPPLRS